MRTTVATHQESASASKEVIRVLSEKTGIDPVELSPLYESVDPDALDALFTPDSREPVLGTATFEHADHEVTISYDGEVVITATQE